MNRNLTILIVEDEENDVLLFKRALKKNEINNPVAVCRNGEDAIDYLLATSHYSNRNEYPFPSVIFLDLKMPGKNGFDVLEWLKNHQECRVIPVIVLTSSREETDIAHAYRLGANSYVVKPSDFNDLVAILRLAYDYWAVCEKPKVPAQC